MTATPPRADLRTLAAEALGLSVIGAKLPPAEVTIRHADAVLAAVLPEHRRMVLGEIADDLHRVATHLRATNPDSSVAKGVRYAEARIRAQLTVAPPAALSAPVPAENAPAAPEEADGQRAGEGDGLTYAEMEAERDRLAGEVFTLTNSESLDVVAAELEQVTADRDRLAAQVAQALSVHQRIPYALESGYFCGTCQETWPCETVTALSDAGTDQTEDDHDAS